jgi:hypothetical protein
MPHRVVMLLALAVPWTAEAAEVAVPANDRAALSLTLHQDGPALVRDRRVVVLDKGPATLVLDGIPRTIRPGAAALEGKGLSVAERWIEPGSLSAERQLAAHLGASVAVIWDKGEPPHKAVILSAGPVPLFSVDGKVVAGQPQRILYDSLAPGLSAVPSFHARVEAETSGRRELDLSYAADGLSWTSAASGELKGNQLALTVWADLANASGADFTNASLRLVAGTTHAGGGMPKMMMARAPSVEATSLPAREAVGIYHVYTLPRAVTLRDGESRQVPLLPPAQVEVSRELALEPQSPYVFQSRSRESRPQHPVLRLAFVNTAETGLGKPLPAGPLRVTMRGSDGEMVLLGESQLPALPVGGEARLTLGEAFDITARRVQTDFQKVSADVTETAWEVKLANGGTRTEVVVVREAFASDWLILEESLPHRKESASQAHWSVEIPAKGQAVLRYRVRIK